jgi:flagellar L-ring protein precursor FlgH
MTRHGVWVLAALVLVAAAATPAAASPGNRPLIDLESGSSLVTNLKAYRIGDLVTILITEKAAASADASTKADNKSEHSGGPGLGFLDFIRPWGLDVENKYEGDGDTERNGSLRAEITARITEVLHNGDFRVAGTRMININGEKQLIEITGICRARDISPDNTIMSTFISDAQIAYNGSGLVTDSAQPGVVTRILNWLF